MIILVIVRYICEIIQFTVILTSLTTWTAILASSQLPLFVGFTFHDSFNWHKNSFTISLHVGSLLKNNLDINYEGTLQLIIFIATTITLFVMVWYTHLSAYVQYYRYHNIWKMLVLSTWWLPVALWHKKARYNVSKYPLIINYNA